MQLDSDRLEMAAQVLLSVAGRPMGWDALDDYEKEAWRYCAAETIRAYMEP